MTIDANEIDYISNAFRNSNIENIDIFFLQNPQKKNVIFVPKIKGKSRYSFSIPKDAYNISKKHTDASDLFYLSVQTDNGLKFQSNK